MDTNKIQAWKSPYKQRRLLRLKWQHASVSCSYVCNSVCNHWSTLKTSFKVSLQWGTTPHKINVLSLHLFFSASTVGGAYYGNEKQLKTERNYTGGKDQADVCIDSSWHTNPDPCNSYIHTHRHTHKCGQWGRQVRWFCYLVGAQRNSPPTASAELGLAIRTRVAAAICKFGFVANSTGWRVTLLLLILLSLVTELLHLILIHLKLLMQPPAPRREESQTSHSESSQNQNQIRIKFQPLSESTQNHNRIRIRIKSEPE